MALAVPGAAWFSNHPLADRWLSGTARDLAIAAAVVLISVNLAAVGALVLASGLGVIRPWRDPRGRWAAVLVLVAANVAIPVMAFSLRAGGRHRRARWATPGWPLATGVALALFVTIVQLFRRSQQWEALSADEALRRDPRAPVVVPARVHRRRADGGSAGITGRTACSARRRAR